MTKTRRQIEADLKQVDAVCEIVDARIPLSSRNPDIDAICGSKPRMIVLNRMDLADPAATSRWKSYFEKKGMAVIATDCKTKRGISGFTPAARKACTDSLTIYAKDAAKGVNATVPADGQTDYLGSDKYAQHNWVAITLPQPSPANRILPALPRE